MKKIILITTILSVLFLFFIACGSNGDKDDNGNDNRCVIPAQTSVRNVTNRNTVHRESKYHLHTNIIASTFWAGEPASGDNGLISNVPSAWHNWWGNHYTINEEVSGDGPYIPRDGEGYPYCYDGTENVYYFALPYNDKSPIVYDGYKGEKFQEQKYDEVVALNPTDYEKGDLYGSYVVKTNAFDNTGRWQKGNTVDIPWYKTPSSNTSTVKGRWARIRSYDQKHGGEKGNGEWVYAQWLDAGPYFYDDFDYVFGNARPRNEEGNPGAKGPFAGIDLSPAVMIKMGFSQAEMGNIGINRLVDWQFVDEEDVPEGPWKMVISNNRTNWTNQDN